MRLRIFTLILMGYTIAGCDSSSSDFKPGYSGSFGELLVVVPEVLWNSPTGDSIFSLFNKPQYGLPQNESPFTVIHVKSEKFSSVLTGHRNVFFVDIKKKYTGQEATYVLQKSKWAKGQVVVEFTAPDNVSFLALLTSDIENILDIFTTAEMNRLVQKNKKFGSKEIRKEILKSQGYRLYAQKDMRIEKTKENLVWLRLEREMPKGGFQHQISQGILIVKQPYTAKKQFLDTNISLAIDSILKAEIPGPKTSDYMGIADQYIQPKYKELNFKENFCKSATGLWEMKGNFFGGPFYELTILHPNKKEILFVYGYVFAPQFNKREYLREVKAVMHSIDFAKD